MSRIGQGIKKSILTANSVLYAVTASVPAALSMAASRILGRKSSGNIAAMTVAELLTLIGVEAGATADLTGDEIVTLLEALGSGSQLSHDELDDVSTSDHHTKYSDANARAAAVSDAIYGAGWNGVTTIAASKNAVYDKIETLGAGAQIASGTYTGDDNDNRVISVGFLCKFVVITDRRTITVGFWLVLNSVGADCIRVQDTDNVDDWEKPYLHASNGFVLGIGDPEANDAGDTYDYTAFG